MNYEKKFNELSKKNDGVILTKEAEKEGIPRQYLSTLVGKNELERVAQGIYITPDTFIDEMFYIQVRSERIIFSHETALYLHDLTDRDPLYYSVTVPRGYATNRLRESGVAVYTVKKELHLLGMEIKNTIHGRNVQVYDIDRTICDVIRSRNQMDKNMFYTGLNRYVRSKEKNLKQLMEYAKEFRIEKMVLHYLEGLLL